MLSSRILCIQILAALFELPLVNILFPRNVLVELRCSLVTSPGSIFPPLPIIESRLPFFPDALGQIMLDAGFLNIISRQIVLFAYLTASAFFDVVKARRLPLARMPTLSA